MARKLEIPNLDYLVERYQAGESLKQIADQSGLSRPLLHGRLKSLGIHIRGHSEAERLKWLNLKRDRSAIERQCSSAWQARRGQKDGIACRKKRAQTAMDRLLRIGRFEEQVSNAMPMKTRRQLAIGPYNVDIAISETRIAVEIVCGEGFNRSATTRPKRIEYLLNRGWFVLVVWLWPGTTPDIGKLRQHIIALHEFRSRNPTMPGEYRVVSRDAEPASGARLDLHGHAIEVAPHARNKRTRHH